MNRLENKSGRRAVLECLIDCERSVIDITLAIGGTNSAIRNALKWLHLSGLVSWRTGPGAGIRKGSLYTATARAKKVLEDPAWSGYEDRPKPSRMPPDRSAQKLYARYHAKHVERQKLMGLTQEQIDDVFDVRDYKGKDEAA